MHPRRRGHLARTASLCLAVGLSLAACRDGGEVPSVSEPVPAEPVPAEPAPAEPVPAEPAPAEPVPAEPTPDVPAPDVPVPAEPVPAEPVPAEPTPDVPALHPSIDDLPESVVTIVTDDGQEARVDVKVAATVDDRRRGLMEVPELPEGAGMLFVFDEERSGGFWMWNTLVPLDIAYVGDDGAIVEVLAMDPCESDDPDDCPVYPPQASYVAALEVPQGWFTWHGVEPGDRVRWTDPTP